CLMSGTPMPFEYLRTEAKANRMKARLMAIAAEGELGRVYLAPTAEMEEVAAAAAPTDPPDVALPAKALGVRVQEYGMSKWHQLFTKRQLVALESFSALVSEVRDTVEKHAVAAGMARDDVTLNAAGIGALSYAEAVSLYLAFTLDRMMMQFSTLA